jgi:hypothetical protein
MQFCGRIAEADFLYSLFYVGKTAIIGCQFPLTSLFTRHFPLKDSFSGNSFPLSLQKYHLHPFSGKNLPL